MAGVEGTTEILPTDVIARESENDDELRQQLLAGRVPTVETLFRFVRYLAYQIAENDGTLNTISFLLRSISVARIFIFTPTKVLLVIAFPFTLLITYFA